MYKGFLNSLRAIVLTIIIATLCIIFVKSFCGCKLPTAINLDKESKVSKYDAHGTIIYNDFSLGFYGIITDDSLKYLPLKLKKQFMKDGLKVKFNFNKPKKLIHTTIMWGTPIYITKIKKNKI
jgi:hypothetical protein